MKKILIFVLMLSLIASSLVGCFGNETPDASSPESTTDAVVPTEPTDGTTVPTGSESEPVTNTPADSDSKTDAPTDTDAPADTDAPTDAPTDTEKPADTEAPDDGFVYKEYEYPMNTVSPDKGTIADATNRYVIVTGYHGALIPLDGLGEYNKVTITKKTGAAYFSYAFLSSDLVVGYSPTYATGYTRVVYCNDESRTLDIPDNAKYLYIYNNSNDEHVLPKSVKFFTARETATDTSNSFRIATWNIGHFSMGKNKNSAIKDTQYGAYVTKYRNYINYSLNADIICLNEYSANFTPSEKTASSLFANYTQKMEGTQFNYSCNAFYSRIPVSNLKANAFVCNQTAQITHTTLITAKDYYFVSADVTINGKNVTIVSAHLAFDNNKNPDDVNMNQIKELIERFSSYERVVFVGDWNVKEFSYFNLFKDAGYTLANEDSTLGTFVNSTRPLDNIIYKGVKVSDFTLAGTDLSDHYAVYCTVTVD